MTKQEAREQAVRIAAVGLSFALVAFVAAGQFFSAPAAPGENAYRGLEVLTQAYGLIETRYVDPVDSGRLSAGAYRAIVEACDGYGSYLTAEEAAEAGSEPSAEAGLTLVKRPGYGGHAYIASVAPGGPAHAAGIRAGQILRAIEGRSTRTMTLHRSRRMLRGETGASVNVSLFDADSGRPAEKKFTLALAKIPRVPKTERVPAGLRFAPRDFSAETEEALKAALALVRDRQPLLLDLRGMASTDFEGALRWADAFAESGELARVKTASKETARFAEAGRKFAPSRVAVLVDAATVGAPELLAAALRARAGAFVVGTLSYGMAREQELLPLPGGIALLLSTKEYLLPGGEALEGKGVKPDLAAEDNPDTPEDELLDDLAKKPWPAPGDTPVAEKDAA